MKLRLLLLSECNRTCKGCCNKDWDLDELPSCQSFESFDEIFLTGGEPLLVPDLLFSVTKKIRQISPAKIYVYTAWREDPNLLLSVLNAVDGLTLTLHTRKDTGPFEIFSKMVTEQEAFKGKSLRLNVFNGVTTGEADVSNWDVRRGIRWIKDCPLPTDEVFMRLAA